MIRVKRVYEPPNSSDGQRFLVDRLWPRGLRKEALKLTDWNKNVAPSDELRKWYHHDPEKWEEFQKRYFAELEARPEAWEPLARAAHEGNITLLFSSTELRRNNAFALREFLQRRLPRKKKTPARPLVRRAKRPAFTTP